MVRLIDDLARYAAHLPVRAQRDTVGYRVGKFVRRNALACALAGVIASTEYEEAPAAADI